MIYTVQFNAVAVTAQQDLFELVAAATQILRIHELGLNQVSEIGDAQEEGLSILLKSGQTTTGSGGSTPTPVPMEFLAAAATFTAKANNTTKATVGTIVTHHAWSWNVRMPFQMIWTPETRPLISPSRRATVELATTPADSITVSGYITVEQLG